jgi:hypothetical protein
MTRDQTLTPAQTVATSMRLRKTRCGFPALSLSGFAQQQDLTQLSLDDLMNTKVNSASKQAESLCGAPAAIYVTEEDIRRGGFQGDLAI